MAFRDAIRDPANEVYLSVASVWEAVICPRSPESVEVIRKAAETASTVGLPGNVRRCSARSSPLKRR